MRLRSTSSAENAIQVITDSESQTYRSSKSTPCLRSNSWCSSWKVRGRSCSRRLTLRTERGSRLSLCQRERMKVRDCFSIAPRVRTRLPATRCRALGEPDDSRIAIQRLHGGLRIPTAFDRAFGLQGSYARRRPTRWLALRSDNRNPRRNHRTDVGGEICSSRNFGSVSVANEYVQAQSPSFAAIERGPRRLILSINASPEKGFRMPSPQSSPR